MGNEHSRSEPPPPLEPLPHDTGIISAHCSSRQVTLKIQEQVSWSGDTFLIYDAEDRPAFKMQGKAMSFRDKKILFDLRGRPIVNFRHDFSLGPGHKYRIYEGDRDEVELATIRAHSFFGTNMGAEFTNINGSSETLSFSGGIMEHDSEITLPNGRVFATISRRIWNADELVMDKQTYGLTVAPNADVALAICICVALDEASHDG